MRKFTKSMLTLALLALSVGGAKAAVKQYELGQKLTTIASLSGKNFAIVNEIQRKAFYGSTDQNVGFDEYATAFLETNTAIQFRLVAAEGVDGCYYLQSVKADGTDYSIWGGGYLNTTPEGGNNCVFIMGLNGQNGQDCLNGAVWEIVENGGTFSILNKGTGKYLKDRGPALNDDPTYFSFYTLKEKFDTSKNHMLLFTNGAAHLGSPWDYQANYTLTTPLTTGKTYVFEAIFNAVNGGATRLVPSVNGANSQYLDTKGLWANEFTRYRIEFKANAAYNKLEIDLGECGGEVYIDNVSLKEKDTDVNLIANGDFETKGTTGWLAVNNTMEQVENELGAIRDPGVLISVGEAGWRTFRTGSHMEITDSNVKAYVAKYVSEGNYVKLTEVTAVPAWEPVLIEASRGNYQAEIPASVEGFPGDENGLQVNGETPLTANGTYYGLAKKNGVVGFYKVSDEVPAWQIYLRIPDAGAGGAPDFLGFDGDDTTSISELNVKGQTDGEFYNLAGQRVAQPTKGLYIVNGKKVVIK